jgi:hypothetical protein
MQQIIKLYDPKRYASPCRVQPVAYGLLRCGKDKGGWERMSIIHAAW